jgi:Flp pilus assembly protein TadD
LRAAALYGLKQEAEAEPLVRRLEESRALPASVLAALALQLERVGQGEAARRVLQHAVELDRLNQPALVQLLKTSLSLDRLHGAPALIERLLAMRNPPADLLSALRQRLGSDRYIFLPERPQVQAEITAFLQRRKSIMSP